MGPDGIDIEAVYTRYGPMVLRRCRRLLKHEQEAVDAVQDTFIRLLRAEESLDGHALSSLLFRIATNVCLNRIRWRRRHPEDPDEALLRHLAEQNGAEDRSLAGRVLRRLFEQQPESTGLIAVLHWVDGMTHAEVAREVGMSVSGVRKRLRRLEIDARRFQEMESKDAV
ncbi:MAG: sigma-70 family RNA polymerase sigma factor [Myxococcota bacterium]